MKTMKTKAISLFLTVFLVLSSFSVFTACSASYSGADTVYPKEELAENIESEKNTELEYASDYFDKWDFPRFISTKTELAERIYQKNFVEDMPSAYEMACAAGKIFLENYYDETDKKSAEEMTDALINSYTLATGDKYSTYRTSSEYEGYRDNMSGSFVGIGVSVLYSNQEKTMRIEALNEGAGAELAGLLVGDFIISVDGVPLEERGYEATVDAIKGEEGTTVEIGILRDGKELSFTVTRTKVVQKSVEYLIEDGIAYIKITSFKTNTVEQFKEAVDTALSSGSKGIIYDLCDNPGGYLSAVVDMLDYLVPKETPIASFSKDYHKPMYAEDSHFVNLPTVVICNAETASAGELFTAAVRDFSKMKLFPSVTVGTKTYGKGIMQDTFRFSDGSSLTLTVAYYNTPLGDNYHGEGITPDKILDTGTDEEWFEAAKAELLDLIEKTNTTN